MGARHVALIVEDDPDMAAEMVDLLRAIEHDAVVASTKAEAIKKLKKADFCYVLLDLQIKTDDKARCPHLDVGLTFLEETRQRFPHFYDKTTAHMLPIIVVSGQAKDDESIVRAFQVGATDFRRKPLGLEKEKKLEDKIREVLKACGRANHKDCPDINRTLRTPLASAPTTIQEAAECSKSGNWIKMNGTEYTFRGANQPQLVRLLYDGLMSGHAKLHTKTVLKKAGYSDNVDNLYKAFARSTKPWREVIAFDDGHCWLNAKRQNKR